MALALPLLNDGTSWFSYQVELDGRTFGLEFRWNERDASWYLSLRDADDAPLLSGLRVTVGHLYLSRFRLLGLPKGELEFVDTTGQDEDPGFTDLGSRVVLLYTPYAEIPGGLAL
jgi:hypothetical protein